MYPKTREQISSCIMEKIFPGASFAFIKDGHITAFREGLAAVVPAEEPILEEQQYDLASLTKVIVTTPIILQLWEERRLSLDDALYHYLPSFREKKVTLRHLLTHTSAISGYIPDRDTLTAEALKEALIHLPVGPGFGKEVTYTDTNMILLGFVIEELERKTLSAVFEERIAGPLALTKTVYHVQDPWKCAPTEEHPVRGVIRGIVHDPKALRLGDHCGSAGLFSTLREVSVFSQMMLNKGSINSVQLLRDQTVVQLLKDWTPTGDLQRSLGWDLKVQEDKTYLFHSGYTGTFILLDPEDQEAFVFLSNRVHPHDNNSLYLQKRNVILDSYFSEKASSN